MNYLVGQSLLILIIEIHIGFIVDIAIGDHLVSGSLCCIGSFATSDVFVAY